MKVWIVIKQWYQRNRTWVGFEILRMIRARFIWFRHWAARGKRKIQRILHKKKYIKLLKQSAANHFIATFLQAPYSNRVLLVTHKFLNFDGKEIFLGGAERYLIELARLIRELGYEPIIVQGGSQNWLAYYQGVWVVGLDIQIDLLNPAFLLQVLEIFKPNAELIIYSPFSLYTPNLKIPSIGISHGIYWDTSLTEKFFEFRFKSLLPSIRGISRLISVDTTTINWIRTINMELGHRAVYIPNFVDLDAFKPVEYSSETITILYPRRLYSPRGFWLVADCLPEVLEKYSQVVFEFVGQADSEEQRKVQEWFETYPGRVKWYALPPERMMEAYQHADIVLIPTLHSEGTSLSCLEAMACGKCVIATYVGGLPDLIIDGFNGLLIQPNSDSLRNAIEYLIEHKDIRDEMGKNGRRVAETFGIEHWRERWRKEILSLIPLREPISPSKLVIFPYTGISWRNMVQRPHHLATQLAKQGYEVLWIDPEDEFLNPIPHLYVVPLKMSLTIKEREPILWIYYPFAYEEIEKYEDPFVIYDILDDVAIFDNISAEVGQRAREYQRKLLERADIVITSSKALLNQFRDVRSDIIYIPNGVDSKHFSLRVRNEPPIANLKHGPVVGYHGALATWFDASLVEQVARLRPEYTFVLIGPISDEKIKEVIDNQANIYHIETQPYDKLPEYLAWFDVGIIPFKVNGVTNSVRPLKAFEYLSMKIPVVSTPFQEILEVPGVLVGGTAEEFASQIDKAIEQSVAIIETEEVKKLLKESEWERVLQPLLEVLRNKTLGSKRIG